MLLLSGLFALTLVPSPSVHPAALSRGALDARGELDARSRRPCMVDIPRIELPESVTSVLKEQNLKNPNEMSTRQYNEYSGAAIAGTLFFFLVPGAVICNFTGARTLVYHRASNPGLPPCVL